MPDEGDLACGFTMNRVELAEVAGLSEETGKNRLDHFEADGYTRSEVEAINDFWGGMMPFIDSDRETVLKRFLQFLPQRGDEGFVKLMGAYWQDGLRGPFFATMLGREPEE